MRVALGLEYDGTPWHGWQSQPNGQTVQDVLETALGRFLDTPARVAVTCAGRTDAGVHASGQVVHLDTDVVRPDSSWVRGVNAHLPATIAVRWAAEVPVDFHARFSAVRRRYRYAIYNHPVRSPLAENRAFWCFRPLDRDAMREAAIALLGEHDFSSFRSSECQAKSPVKTMESIDWSARGDFVDIHLSANAFLHHMVRNLVGALVEIGAGRKQVAWLAELLAARARRLGAPTAPAAGLCFERVEYPRGFGLEDRR
ncbi:tRNA pseudouridine(38-40) synthase TruA [soil metagenome]